METISFARLFKMTTKTRVTIGGCFLVIVTILLVTFFLRFLRSDPADYHFKEFAKIRANFNDYRPSVLDQLKGIRSNQDKWDFHLNSLEELGAVQHVRFVFTEVPYTREASKHLWSSVVTNFPDAVMFTAPSYYTNAPGYGVEPYVLNVWDFPHRMEAWSNFVHTNNRRK